MIKVLTVDDLNIVRQGIKVLLSEEPDIEIIGSASNGSEAIKIIKSLEDKPDIALVDLLMPVMGGIKLTEEISRQFPTIKVIIVSDLENKKVASCATKMGARGYLLKNKLNTDNLVNAIHSVHNGYIQLDAEIVNTTIKNSLHFSPPSQALKIGNSFDLTDKEQEKSLEDVWL